MAIIKSGSSFHLLDIHPVSLAAHARLMDDNGNPLAKLDGDVWNKAQTRGLPLMGVNPITGQIDPINVDRGGRLRVAQFAPMIFDQFYSNTTLNPAIWQLLSSTMTATQSPQAGFLLNSGNSAAASVGVTIKSNRRVAKQPGSTVVFRASCRVAKVNNSIVEIGFADAGAQYGGTPTALLDQSVGAYWRFSAAGTLVPVVSFNNTDVSTGADVSVKPNNVDFYDYLVTAEDLGFRFAIYSKQGALISEQVLASPVGLPRELAQPSLSALIGVRNTATIPASAPQVSVGQVSVGKYNSTEFVSPTLLSALQGNSVAVLPSTLAQSPSHPASGTAPTAVTLTNAASAAGSSLGGKFVFNAIGGSEADLGLFSVTNTDAVGGGMTFVCTGLRFDVSVGAVAVATTATLMELGLVVGDGPNPNAATNRKLPLGIATFPIGAAVANSAFIDVDFEPVAMLPNRALGTYLRIPVATATATQTFRGSVFMKGSWIA